MANIEEDVDFDTCEKCGKHDTIIKDSEHHLIIACEKCGHSKMVKKEY